MSRIRITGGEWRSRMIQVADGPGLRPTPDRVRETLFNWLGHDLGGKRCLDLFSGSGILGLEAASRGALHVTFVEKSRPAFVQLQKNVAPFADDRFTLTCADALNFVRSILQPQAPRYDLIFLDPPYRQGLLEKIAPMLTSLSSADARLYVEAEHALAHLGDWRTIKHGTAGQVYFHLMERS